jgi:hypothetical protein
VPQNEDGDPGQKNDGDDHEWQKDFGVNGIGGAISGAEFSPDGSGAQRLKMLLPLVEQYFNSDESGAQDPLIQALDQALESEIPGYKDQGDPQAGHQLLIVLKGGGEQTNGEGEIEGEPKKIEESQPDDSDESESKPAEKESRYDFLPYLPTLESSNDPHFRTALAPPTPGTTGVGVAPGMAPMAAPGPTAPTVQGKCPHCGAVTDPSNTTCPQCGAATSMLPGHQGKTAELADNSFMYEHTDIPPGLPLNQFRGQPIQSEFSGANCPNCGSNNDLGDLQCAVCGKPLHNERMASGLNSCVDCGRDCGNGMCGFRSAEKAAETGKPEGITCMNCWSQDHPQGLPPHPNLGVSIPPAGTDFGTPNDPHTSASHQGPHTPEQISAVQQMLIEQNRINEVPDVPLYPENYAEELASLTQSDVPPETDDAGMDAGPPTPAQEEAPPGDTMPVPGMSVPTQMMSAVEKYAADSVARKCPECDSHTTRVVGKDGESQCHACGHTFNSDRKLIDLTSADHGLHPHYEDPTADEQQLQHDPEKDDPTLTWMDAQGSPLQANAYYELYTKNYDIPDLVRIDDVKPGGSEIVYTLMGDGGLNTSESVSKEEADIMGYKFVPSQEGDAEIQPEGLEANNDDNTAYQGAPEESDISTPHALVASGTGTGREWLMGGGSGGGNEGHREWLMDGQHTAGRQYNQWEQRDFIDEDGSARNADKLDLAGTHYEAAYDEAPADQFLFGW